MVAFFARHPSGTHVRHADRPNRGALPVPQRADGGGEGQLLSVVFRDPRCAEVLLRRAGCVQGHELWD